MICGISQCLSLSLSLSPKRRSGSARSAAGAIKPT
jgi:hypothetical protein